MKRTIYCLVVFGGLLLIAPAHTKTQDAGVITICLSYKVVLNPADGSRPPGVTDANLAAAVNGMNDLMRNYFRGYRFQLLEVLDVGGMSNPPAGPSMWYDTDFFGPSG